MGYVQVVRFSFARCKSPPTTAHFREKLDLGWHAAFPPVSASGASFRGFEHDCGLLEDSTVRVECIHRLAAFCCCFFFFSLTQALFGKTADSLERSTENEDEYMIHEREVKTCLNQTVKLFRS